MSISKRVSECLEIFERGDAEAALVSACIAIDATAKRERPSEKKNNVRYRAFLSDYAWLIGLVGLRGIVARKIKLRAQHPDLKPDAGGFVAIEDVLYGVVRCGLLHEASISDHVSLEEDIVLGYDGSKYQLSRTLPLGLIAAVISSPSNAHERLEQDVSIKIGWRTLEVNATWGTRYALAAALASRAL